jgi:hypothetical protein
MFFRSQRQREFLERMSFGQRAPLHGERPPTPSEMLNEIGWMLAAVVCMVTVVLALVWVSDALGSGEHAIATSTTTGQVGSSGARTFMGFL